MTNHTYRRLGGTPARLATPPRVAGTIRHYDRRTLDYRPIDIAQTAILCARCGTGIPPDEAWRDESGEFVCQDEDACDLARERHRRGED